MRFIQRPRSEANTLLSCFYEGNDNFYQMPNSWSFKKPKPAPIEQLVHKKDETRFSVAAYERTLMDKIRRFHINKANAGVKDATDARTRAELTMLSLNLLEYVELTKASPGSGSQRGQDEFTASLKEVAIEVKKWLESEVSEKTWTYVNLVVRT